MPSDIHISAEECKNWLQALAIVVGGVWTLWVFRYKARANIPSLDGDLSIESTVLSPGGTAGSNANSSKNAAPRLAVSVSALWNNRGKFPVKLDPESIAVYAFIIPADLRPYCSDLSDRDKLTPAGTQKPFENKSQYILEPKSQSTLRAHFILEQGPVYLFRWEFRAVNKFTLRRVKKLRQKELNELTWEKLKEHLWKGPSWEKEIIWNSVAGSSRVANGSGRGNVENDDEPDEKSTEGRAVEEVGEDD